MIIDCDRCEVRGDACGSCVIGVLMEVHEDDRPIPYLPVDLPGTELSGADLPGADTPGAGLPGAELTGAELPGAGGAGGGGRPAQPAGLRAAGGGPASAPVEFAEPERRALQVLAEGGLIPHLRLVETGTAGPERAAPLLPVPVVPSRAPRHREVG